jgi:hypothetical protein
VIAGILKSMRVVIRAEKVGPDILLSQIVQMGVGAALPRSPRPTTARPEPQLAFGLVASGDRTTARGTRHLTLCFAAVVS